VPVLRGTVRRGVRSIQRLGLTAAFTGVSNDTRRIRNRTTRCLPEEVTAFSQSSLNTYVNSPRDYFFSRLVDNPDKDHFREGNLFHDFAEFYVSHPDTITTDTLDEVAAVILDEVDPFLRGVDREVRLTKYRVGLQTIVEFLDANPPKGDGLSTPDSGWGENFSPSITTAPSMRRTPNAGSRTLISG